MEIAETELEGVHEIKNRLLTDERGLFLKTFHSDIFRQAGLDSDFKESFYSVSKRNVLRGMHFQTEPFEHNKLVYVTAGEVLDVVVDIRRRSATFGHWFSLVLSDKNAKSLYISKGFAHGFLSLSESATVVYLTSTVYAPEHDKGIRWDSFDFNWRISGPILSERDRSFPSLEEYVNA